jgi:hypothetical protein
MWWLPNVFGLARAQGYNTAEFFSKAKFQPLQVEGTLDYSQAPGGWFGRWSSERTVNDVAKYLVTARPYVLFVHLTDPDAAGTRRIMAATTHGTLPTLVPTGRCGVAVVRSDRCP